MLNKIVVTLQETTYPTVKLWCSKGENAKMEPGVGMAIMVFPLLLKLHGESQFCSFTSQRKKAVVLGFN